MDGDSPHGYELPMRLPLTLIVALFVSVEANAQVCTVGKRCGNTCINVNDTCHIDDGGGGVSTPVVVGSLVVLAALAGWGIWAATDSGTLGATPHAELIDIGDDAGRPVVTRAPAYVALKPGDVIVRANEYEVRRTKDVQDVLNHIDRSAKVEPFCLSYRRPSDQRAQLRTCFGEVERRQLRFRWADTTPRGPATAPTIEVGDGTLMLNLAVPF